jgi:hypothetical protein
MTNYASKNVLVIDNGLFTEMAVMLSKSFKRVYYTSPWTAEYPKTIQLLVGTGIPGVKRINDFWPLIDEIDLFVFPDIYYGGLQEYLASIGKRVWGSRRGELLELDRDKSKQICDSVGIDISPYTVVTGMDSLRKYLLSHKDVYVKISFTRGDMETLYCKQYSSIEPVLDNLEYHLGPAKDRQDFIIEEAVHDASEVSYDGFCIDGQWPKNSMWGIEIKDRAHTLSKCDYDKLPASLIDVHDKLSSVMKGFKYRGWFSTEILATKDGRAYLMDPCCRCGCPPNELYQMMITNWPDIIWEGADGVLVEPTFSAKHGAELLFESEWAQSNWQPIEFPKKIRDNVKIFDLCIIDGKHYCVPRGPGASSKVGAVVATGDTMEEAIKNVRSIAEQIDGHHITCDTASLDEVQEEVDKLIALGFKP